MATHTIEDYLKAIYKLEENGELATPALIGALVGFSATAVNNTLKKLVKMKLVTYKPYSEVKLTKSGKKIALEVIRHHRLLELYLVEAVGLSWDQVDTEAEKLEHVLSESLEERIDQLLGSPKTDPHGEPIPTKEGEVETPECQRLSKVELGEIVRVRKVDDSRSDLLRYLGGLGIYPEVKLKLLGKLPFDRALVVKIGKRQRVIGIEAANRIFVSQ